MARAMAEPLHLGVEPATARVIAVVLHGRGQTQDDMVKAIVGRLYAPAVRFVLPKAEAAAWYDARAIDPLTEVTRAQVENGLDAIAGVVRAELAAAPLARLVIAGFSQGACMAAEYLMREGPWPGALCLFTGCRVGTADDTLPQASLRGMRVYASCGDADPWIPVSAFHRLIADLTAAGARVRADLFPGRPHIVSPTELSVLQGILHDLAAGHEPLEGAV